MRLLRELHTNAGPMHGVSSISCPPGVSVLYVFDRKKDAEENADGEVDVVEVRDLPPAEGR
jgi:hypothetical protein